MKRLTQLLRFFIVIGIFTISVPSRTFAEDSTQVRWMSSNGNEIVIDTVAVMKTFSLPKDAQGNYYVESQRPTKQIDNLQETIFGVQQYSNAPSVLGVIGNDDRTRITDTTKFPYSAIVQISQVISSGLAFNCTGWMFGRNVVATAAHCIYERDKGRFFDGVYKITPALDDSRNPPAPYGSCTPQNGIVQTKYLDTSSTDSDEYDFGIIFLNCGIGDYTGWFGFRELPSTIAGSMQIRVTGYPTDKGGRSMWTAVDIHRDVTTRSISYFTDATGGESGSPVLEDKYLECVNCAIATHRAVMSSGSVTFNIGAKVNSEIFATLLANRESAFTRLFIPIIFK